MKIVGYIVLVVAILILIALLYYLIVGMIIFKKSLGRKTLKKRVKKNDLTQNLEKYNIDLCWWDNLPFKKVEIKSYDNLKLVAHFLNQQSDRSVIIVHGYSANYKEMQQYAKFFYQRGFNLLCVELRAHGESEGECVGMGYLDRKDILNWIEFLNNEITSNILLMGLSMGASAVCATTGENLQKNVKAVISDSAFDSAERQIKHVLKKFVFLKNLLYKHLKSYAKRGYNFNLQEADFVKCVKKTKIPILYFHGKADNYVPFTCSQNLYNATPENLRELVLVDDADHGMCYPVLKVMYERKINNFLKKYHIFE